MFANNKVELIASKNILPIIGEEGEFNSLFLELFAQKKLIIVSNSGLDYKFDFKDKNVNNFLVLSEYPFQESTIDKQKISTNRIKQGICDGILLVNSIKHNYLFQVLNFMIQKDLPIFCFDADPNDFINHNHFLLEKGANNFKDFNPK